jgi:hypothetical protein
MSDVNGRSNLEKWLDKHNHFMAFLRTLTSGIAAVASTIVLYKIW